MVNWRQAVVDRVTRTVSRVFRAMPRALDPTDDRYYDTTPGYLSRSGIDVTADSTRKVGAAYRCISILANVLAMFPKGMYERLERGRRPAPEHPLDKIISFAPNKRQTAFEFWRLVCHHLVLRQNAFIQIVPGTSGRGWVGELVPLHPDRVRGPEELPSGAWRYEYTRPNGEKILLIGGQDIWHLQGLSEDGLRGLSMMNLASDTIGLSLASERHASRFFEKGVKVSGVLSHPGSLKPDVAEGMADSFGRRWGGENSIGGVPVLWEGMKFEPISMSLKDAEFLDSRKFSVAEIARWFGVPPHMVGDVERSTSWGTGIEQQGLHFLVYSLLPWIELLEQSIRFTLVVQSERFYAKFNASAILRMDAKTQAEVFDLNISNGILNPNEARELLDLNPRKGGDAYVDPAKKATPPVPPPLPSPPDDEEEEEEEEDDAGEATAKAQRLAQSHVDELLTAEANALLKLAPKHAASSKSWRAAVARFYGRFPVQIAATGILPQTAAKTWCVARRELVLTNGGLYQLVTEGTPAADAVLLGEFNANA